MDQSASRPRPGVRQDAAVANPVLIEVTRGGIVESRHRGACAVVDAAGDPVASWGDLGRAVYPRSAIKPLQALALIESGAAEAFDVSDAELALASASHSGEPRHVAVAAAWLARLGLGPGDLECGPHPPVDQAAGAALVRKDEAPGAIHNNCSGKHVAMLATALHTGAPTRGYVEAVHPVQVRIRGVLEELSGCELAGAGARDGCSVPTYAMPLRALALAMARFADPARLPPGRAAAAARIATAMAAHPFLVAGSGRFGSAVIATAGTEAIVKIGAEGVYTAALPGLGLGVALKIDDGASRAAELAMAHVLRHLGVLDEGRWPALAAHVRPRLVNRAGIEVGLIRPAPGWPG